MEDIFITKIHIKEVRHIKDFEIPLSETERKHLILTGRNGSGKTSVLEALRDYLNAMQSGKFAQIDEDITILESKLLKINEQLEEINKDDQHSFLTTKGSNLIFLRQQKKDLEESILEKRSIFQWLTRAETKIKSIEFLYERYRERNFIISFFGAQRFFELNLPTQFQKVELKSHYSIDDKANAIFLEYLAHLKAMRSFAANDNDIKAVAQIDKWFEIFETFLKEILEDRNLKLVFDFRRIEFSIVTSEGLVLDFNTLSAGYSSVLNIISELIIRMERNHLTVFDLQGIVLIDEIETHLHIDLQKQILPFLCKIFPKIQFIVTTHSPFVINSVKNAVVCDLEKRIVIDEDLTGYSSKTLVESYFDSDDYSNKLKKEIAEYEELKALPNPNEKQRIQLLKLEKYFSTIPTAFSPELAVKLQQIKLKYLKPKPKTNK